MGDGGVLVPNDKEAPEIHDDGFEAEEVREEESENEVRRKCCYPVACINGTQSSCQKRGKQMRPP